MTHMEWEQMLLHAIESLGGEAHLQDIYSWIEENAPLTSEHLRSTRHGGRPAYQHQVRSHLSNLCQRNALVWVRRAVYALP